MSVKNKSISPSLKNLFPLNQDLIYITAATILCLVPFANKAFHIDDTLFLWVAQHIQANPFDFFGFTANWYGIDMPMAEIQQNPPMVSYFIALITFLFGWDEISLHLAFLLPAVGVIWGTYRLAGHFCQRPLLAALASLLTPVFLISSTSIMSDTMMVCFYVWTLVFWLRGLGKVSHLLLLVAGLLLAMSALTKYFGITLIPLLFAYSLAKFRGLHRSMFYLLLPVFILVGYQWLTTNLYGFGHLSSAASYAVDHNVLEWSTRLSKNLISLAFLGGGIASIFFFIPVIWPRRSWLVGMGIVLPSVALILLLMGTLFGLELRSGNEINWGVVLQLTFFISAGVHIIGLTVFDLWKERNADSLLLVLWMLGTFCFLTYFNWTINGRTILPMVPVAAILFVRSLDRRWPAKGSNDQLPAQSFAPYVLPFLFAAGLALAVTWADYKLANTQRTAARVIVEDLNQYNQAGIIGGQFKKNPPRIWFQGHWGFQYYMEALGALPLDFYKQEMMAGEFLVIPDNNSNTRLPPQAFSFIKEFQLPASRWLGTMQKLPVGAGFYATVWGPLPFVAGNIPTEKYWLYRLGN